MKRAFLVAALLSAAATISAYQDKLTVADPVSSQDGLVAVFADAFTEVASEVNFQIAANARWFANDSIGKAIEAAQADSLGGGLYYTRSSFSWSQSSSTSPKKVKATIEYAFPAKSAIQKIQQVDQAADDIVASLINDSMSDYDKEIALHDYIVNNARYDLKNYQQNTVPAEEYTPYGVLIKKTGVCESYAKAFKLLGTKAGLEVRLLSGTADGGSHSWNVVKIDGAWYQLDVTFDDPTGGDDKLSYRYFNLTDKAIATNHVWKQADAPPCTASDANFYFVNDLTCKDLKELTQLVKDTMNSKGTNLVRRVISFSPGNFSSSVQQILNTAASSLKYGISYSYSVDAQVGVVELSFEY